MSLAVVIGVLVTDQKPPGSPTWDMRNGGQTEMRTESEHHILPDALSSTIIVG
jgi:hypothetical protein